MNAKQKEAVEILKNKFEQRVQKENSFRKTLKLEIKKFEIHESDQEFIDLIGYNIIQVNVTMGYVGDEKNLLLLDRDHWNIVIGKNGGFSTTKRSKKGKRLKTKINGLDNCVLQGSYRI